MGKGCFFLFFLSLYWICYNTASFYLSVFWSGGIWDLNSLMGIEPATPALEEVLATGPPGNSQGLSSLSHEELKGALASVSGLDGALLSRVACLSTCPILASLYLPLVLVSRAVTSCSEIRWSISVLLDTGSWDIVCVYVYGFLESAREDAFTLSFTHTCWRLGPFLRGSLSPPPFHTTGTL